MRSLALRLRAEARGLIGDRVAALDDARRAAELVPGDARAWNALGIAAADAGASPSNANQQVHPGAPGTPASSGLVSTGSP